MTQQRRAGPLRRITPALGLAALLSATHAAAAQQDTSTTAVTQPAGTDTTRRTAGTAPSTATATSPTTTAAGTTAAAGPRVDSLLTASAYMGTRIRLRTRGVDEWTKTAGNDPKKLVLYLDGRAMQGAVAQRVSGAGSPELWEVHLQRSDSARGAWEAVLGRPDSRVRNVPVGLGPASGPQFATAPGAAVTLALVVAPRWLLWLTALVWLAAIAAFIYLARTTGIIRDSPAPILPTGDPAPPSGVTVVPTASGNPVVAGRRAARTQRMISLALRPYSMARTQMAFWFILVTTSFLAIWMITGDTHGIITTQALFLIGLGAGTALAAGMVESDKREVQRAAATSMTELNARASHLQARTPGSLDPTITGEMGEVEAERDAVMRDTPEAPASKGFFRDILSDKDGPALHRYQHLVWTLIVGAIFLVGAYNTLALPKIDDTMLLLMGISAATYVGFKTRENRT